MHRMILFFLFGVVIFFSSRITAQEDVTLSGTISFEGTVPAKKILKITKDKAVCGVGVHYNQSLLVGKDNGLQNAVVSIALSGKKDMKSLGTDFSLHQTGCKFIPHILIIPVRTPLQIFNNDGILHNIHSSSKKNRPFNLAQPKYKKKIEKTFKKPEIVKLRCDVHSWMTGYIVVVDHPYHAITNENGKFTISGLPPGTYLAEVWHEKLGKKEKEITIKVDAPAKLDLVFRKPSKDGKK